MQHSSEVVIAGAGPAGLACAEVLARAGRAVAVVEQGHEIGSPVRTSGGSFIDEMAALGIPPDLYHPISKGRFLSPHNAAAFDFGVPRMCVIDVRGVFQFLAGRAIQAGAHVHLRTPALAPIFEHGVCVGVRTQPAEFRARVTVDATGHRSVLLKQAGLDPQFERFGVGAEYDLFAPHCDQDEAVLLVGDEVAPSGYAWIFPWGRNRVRVGVGVIHPDSREKPDEYLDRLVAGAGRCGVNLRGAQPIEHHSGLIPSERFAERFAADGILGVGDAVGNASSLLGEGIRWAIVAGRMAGEAVAEALDRDDVSQRSLSVFEQRWRARFGNDLRLAHRINRRIASWSSAKWDQRLELLKLLTPEQFIEALKTNLTGGWLWKFLRAHPGALARVAQQHLPIRGR